MSNYIWELKSFSFTTHVCIHFRFSAFWKMSILEVLSTISITATMWQIKSLNIYQRTTMWRLWWIPAST